MALMRSSHAEVKAAYGWRRMGRERHDRGCRIGLRRVERLMRENRIRARHKRRFKATKDSRHSTPIAPTCWRATSRPSRPTRGGRATSRTSTQAKAGRTWPSCWTCSTARSSAGRSSPHDRLDEPRGQLPDNAPSRCSATGVVVTPRWATARRCGSFRTGSAGMLLGNPMAAEGRPAGERNSMGI